MRLTKLVVLLILTSLAVACVQSNGVRFHNLPKFGNNKTIVVLSSDPGKKGGLEFQVYADLVSGYLKKNGYAVVSREDSNVELVAYLDYAVGSPKTHTDVTPVRGVTGGGDLRLDWTVSPLEHFPI